MNFAGYWNILRKPTIALALGVAPFWLFVGATNNLTVNGEVVAESRFNLLGVALGIAGIVIAFQALRERGVWFRSVLAGIALPVSVVQVAWSAELVTRKNLYDWVLGWPLPDEPEYAAPSITLYQNERREAHEKSEAELRQNVIDEYGLMLARFSAHKNYAEACHKGQLRLEEYTLQPPEFVLPADREKIAGKEEETLAEFPDRPCSAQNSRRMMKGMPEAIFQQQKKLAVIMPAYRWRLVTSAQPDATSHPLEGDPILAAAEDGDMWAQAYLGDLYFFGQIASIPQNDEQAAVWYRKVAEKGMAAAQAKLGLMYREGRGVARDYDQAVQWSRKAAEQGHIAGELNLGLLYEGGYGVPRDDAQAAAWFRKVADKGGAQGKFKLARMYADGRGVDRDPERAEALFQDAAKEADETVSQWLHELAEEEGSASAQSALGTMYFSGRADLRDDAKAAQWYRKAADQGHAGTQFALAVMYTKGDGLPQDDEQAVAWLREAARQGHAASIYHLGLHYMFGRGVPVDLEEAGEFLRIADEMGYPRAPEALAELEKMKSSNR